MATILFRPHCCRFEDRSAWKQIFSQPMDVHYNDVIMGTMAPQITSLTIVYTTVYSGADQRKYQSSASLAFVRGIHRRPGNSPHKWPVAQKCFPFDDVIMWYEIVNDQRSYVWFESLFSNPTHSFPQLFVSAGPNLQAHQNIIWLRSYKISKLC